MVERRAEQCSDCQALMHLSMICSRNTVYGWSTVEGYSVCPGAKLLKLRDPHTQNHISTPPLDPFTVLSQKIWACFTFPSGMKALRHPLLSNRQGTHWREQTVNRPYFQYCSVLKKKVNDTVCTLTCVEDSLCQDGPKFGHNIIMLVIDHLCIKLSELVHLK